MQLADKEIVVAMDTVRDICSKLLEIRSLNNIRTRQPLQSMTIIDPGGKYAWLVAFPDMVQIIRDEVNIKQVFLLTNNYEVELNPKEESC